MPLSVVSPTATQVLSSVAADQHDRRPRADPRTTPPQARPAVDNPSRPDGGKDRDLPPNTCREDRQGGTRTPSPLPPPPNRTPTRSKPRITTRPDPTSFAGSREALDDFVRGCRGMEQLGRANGNTETVHLSCREIERFRLCNFRNDPPQFSQLIQLYETFSGEHDNAALLLWCSDLSLPL